MYMKYKYKLSIILTLALSLALSSCGSVADETDTTEVASAPCERRVMALERTEDMGKEYIDSFIFFGESTTYHLKSRGVLSGGKDTKQVWGPRSGTVNLDSTVSTLKIVYPRSGEEMTVGEAAAREKPKYMLLSFGLNGAVQKIKQGDAYFKSCYLSLINEIKSNSPDTAVILGSCFPIAADMDMSNYSVDAATLNSYISRLNEWTQELAHEQGLAYLDTAEALCNDDGFLESRFDAGDGHHLTEDAYRAILEYIRTHGYKEKS